MGDKTPYRLCRIESDESDAFLRFARLTETVFGESPPPWPIWALFDGDRCVAGLQCRLLDIACDGVTAPMAALRNIAVAPDLRGLGLMRDLLECVLSWCDAKAQTTLLYTETPALYARFAFAPLPQHAFEGPAPVPLGQASARAYEASRDADLAARLLAERCPVSSSVAVVDDGGLTAASLASGDWPVFYDRGLDALIVCERERDTFVLVDIVAPRMPSASAVLGTLGERPWRLRTMFPPDRLAWEGAAVPEDAGLMVRGTLPPAMQRPFMLSPTLEF